MPCDKCKVQFNVFRRKRSCNGCKRFYCNNCITSNAELNFCETCLIFTKKPLNREELLKLKPKDLIFYLQTKKISTAGCLEKEELINLILMNNNEMDGKKRQRSSPTSPESSHSFGRSSSAGRSGSSVGSSTSARRRGPSTSSRRRGSSASSRRSGPSTSTGQSGSSFGQFRQTCQNIFSKFSNDFTFDRTNNTNVHNNVATREIPTYASSSSSQQGIVIYVRNSSSESGGSSRSSSPSTEQNSQPSNKKIKIHEPSPPIEVNDDVRNNENSSDTDTWQLVDNESLPSPSLNSESQPRPSSGATSPNSGSQSDRSNDVTSFNSESQPHASSVAISVDSESQPRASSVDISVDSESRPGRSSGATSPNSESQPGRNSGPTSPNSESQPDGSSGPTSESQPGGSSGATSPNSESQPGQGSGPTSSNSESQPGGSSGPTSPNSESLPGRNSCRTPPNSDSQPGRSSFPTSPNSQSQRGWNSDTTSLNSDSQPGRSSDTVSINSDSQPDRSSDATSVIEVLSNRSSTLHDNHNECETCGFDKTRVFQIINDYRYYAFTHANPTLTQIKRYMDELVDAVAENNPQENDTEYSMSDRRGNNENTSPTNSSSLDERLKDIMANNRVDLRKFKSFNEIKHNLSVAQLKQILRAYRVEYGDCLEKTDLVDKVKRLYDQVINAPNIEDLSAEDICKICMNAPVECIFLDCGHLVSCTNCGKVLSECPICRRYILRAVRFFRA